MTAVDYYAPMERLRDDLSARGIRATTDPQTVNPDCVLIELDQITDWTLGDAAEVHARLFLVTRDTAVPYAHKALGELLGQVDAALTDLNLPVLAEIVPALVKTSDGQLPALTFTTAVSA